MKVVIFFFYPSFTVHINLELPVLFGQNLLMDKSFENQFDITE